VDQVEDMNATSTKAWRPLLGVGLAEDLHTEWLWRHVLTVLGLEVNGVVAICWGQARLPTAVAAAVCVPKDQWFSPDPTRLVAALENLAHVSEPDDGKVRLSVDIFVWVDWLVSRAEEYNPLTLDEFGNFPREESLVFTAGLAEQPAADLLISALRAAVETAARSAGIEVRRTSPWPSGKRFAVCLTHDIDYAVRQSATGALRKVAAAAVSLSQGQRRTASPGLWTWSHNLCGLRAGF
jgi:hypothetical protein